MSTYFDTSPKAHQIFASMAEKLPEPGYNAAGWSNLTELARTIVRSLANEVGLREDFDTARRVQSEMVVENIEPNYGDPSIFSNILPERRREAGFMLKARTHNILYATNFVKGMKPKPQILLPRDLITYHPDSAIVTYAHDYYTVRRGDPFTMETIRANMRGAINDYKFAAAFTVFRNAWNGWNGSSNYFSTTQAGLLTAIDAAISAIRNQSGGNTPVAIMGTHRALKAAYSATTTTIAAGTTTGLAVNSLLERYQRTGSVDVYRNATFVEIPQLIRRSSTSYDAGIVPDDLVFVVGGDAGELSLYPGMDGSELYVQESIDYDTVGPRWTLSFVQDFGISITAPERISVINITNP